MTAPRLIRLVPTGEVFQGVDLVEPCEVQPLSEEHLRKVYEQSCGQELRPQDIALVTKFARGLEQAHGIGRRMDA